MPGDLDSLLKEKRIFKPSLEFVKDSNIYKWMEKRNIKDYDELLELAEKDPEWFWDELAHELEWFEPYTKTFNWNPPHAEWFVNGKFNIVQNAIDRHAHGEQKDKTAFIWEGESGEVRSLTYKQLQMQVNKFANVLRDLGVKKGDTVSIYLPMILELPIAMLACAKIGAIHSVVFSGFWAKAFQERINDADSKVAITADGFTRRGKQICLKENVDVILENTPSIQKLIVVEHAKIPIEMDSNRDIWWHEAMEKAVFECTTEEMDPEDPLFILYTSGTTGKPKGVVHVHGGYGVGVYTTLKFVFDIKPDDIWWCAADIGWITGHSYIVYAPLMMGATSVIYEGTPDYPDPGRVWSMIEKYNVSVFYTAPTTVRMFMKFGEKWPEKYDISSLRLLGSVGEPINPEAWIWYHEVIGKSRCPIMDTWWQTETGMHLITPLPISDLKPGSAVKPFPTIVADVIDDDGNSIKGGGGHLVIKSTWPAMFRTLYNDPNRYEAYWSSFKNTYLSGDVARKDDDGYFWIQGREDDVLNVAGHRISTAEVESALVSHPGVAEAAVVGKPDEIKGEEISAFVVIKENYHFETSYETVLRHHVRTEIGPIATPKYIKLVGDLPKTRSGKIMRRVIKARVKGETVGDTSTLANPEAVKEIEKLD
ncbi:acetate/CoA ligase [Methanobacterium lacus]|uniref:Acetate--CoA ligase n=1 Tax=Methanobacterium lacus (strain AL-21) TaxID=877455 RepID=F0T9Z5_METLA|nr:acetate--CoA ligase [Methanobacterium lacus]ADZ08818.1 acetate/CoA ligase [Methanobacterium lacus]